MAKAAPKLSIELVPSTCWGSNLWNILPTRDWDRIRRSAYRAAGYRCEVCDGQGPRHPVECHEVWAYDEREEVRVQQLVRMIALYPTCHAAKHLGRTSIVALEMDSDDTDGLALIREVREHVKRVNGWSDEEYKAYARAAGREHAERSQHEWDLDLTALAPYGIDLGIIPAEERFEVRMMQGVASTGRRLRSRAGHSLVSWGRGEGAEHTAAPSRLVGRRADRTRW